jgi:hypothetical protein
LSSAGAIATSTAGLVGTTGIVAAALPPAASSAQAGQLAQAGLGLFTLVGVSATTSAGPLAVVAGAQVPGASVNSAAVALGLQLATSVALASVSATASAGSFLVRQLDVVPLGVSIAASASPLYSVIVLLYPPLLGIINDKMSAYRITGDKMI